MAMAVTLGTIPRTQTPFIDPEDPPQSKQNIQENIDDFANTPPPTPPPPPPFSTSPPQIVPKLMTSLTHFTPRANCAITATLLNARMPSNPTLTTFSNPRKIRTITDGNLANNTIRGGIQSLNLSFMVRTDRRAARTLAEHQIDIFNLMRKASNDILQSTSQYLIVNEEKKSSRSYLLPQSARGIVHASNDPKTLVKSNKRISLQTPLLNAILVDSPSFYNLHPDFNVSSTPRKVIKPQSKRALVGLTMGPAELEKLQDDLKLQEENKSPTDNDYHCALVNLYKCLSSLSYIGEVKKAKKEKRRSFISLKKIINIVQPSSRRSIHIESPFTLDKMLESSQKPTVREAKNKTESQESSKKRSKIVTLRSSMTSGPIILPANEMIAKVSEMPKESANSRKLMLTKSYRNLNVALKETPPNPSPPIEIPPKPQEVTNTSESSPPTPPDSSACLKELKRLSELKEILSLDFIFNPKDDITLLQEEHIKKLYNLRAVVEDHLRIESALVIKYPIPTQFITMRDLRTIEKFTNALLSIFNRRDKDTKITTLEKEIAKFDLHITADQCATIICNEFKNIIQTFINCDLRKFSESKHLSDALDELFTIKSKKLIKDQLSGVLSKQSKKSSDLKEHDTTESTTQKFSSKSQIKINNKCSEIFKIICHYASALLFKTMVFQSIESIITAENISVDNNYHCIVETPSNNKVPFQDILNLYFAIPMHFYALKMNKDLLKKYRQICAKIHFKKRKAEISSIIDPDLIEAIYQSKSTTFTSSSEKSVPVPVFTVFKTIIGNHQRSLLEQAAPILTKLGQAPPTELRLSTSSEEPKIVKLKDIHLRFLRTLAIEELKDPAKCQQYSVEFISILKRFFAKTGEEDSHLIAKKLLQYALDDPKILPKVNEIFKLHNQLEALINKPIKQGDSSPKEISKEELHASMCKLLENKEILCIFDGESLVDAFERIGKCYDFFREYDDAINALEGKWEKLVSSSSKDRQQAAGYLKNLDYESFFNIYMGKLNARYYVELNALVECYKAIVIKILDIVSIPGSLNGKELNRDLVKLLKVKLKIIFKSMDRILWEGYYDLLQSTQTHLGS